MSETVPDDLIVLHKTTPTGEVIEHFRIPSTTVDLLLGLIAAQMGAAGSEPESGATSDPSSPPRPIAGQSGYDYLYDNVPDFRAYVNAGEAQPTPPTDSEVWAWVQANCPVVPSLDHWWDPWYTEEAVTSVALGAWVPADAEPATPLRPETVAPVLRRYGSNGFSLFTVTALAPATPE